MDAPAFPIAFAPGSPRLGPFQFVILTLSLVVLGMLIAETFFHLPREIVSVLTKADTLICGVFLIDFAVRFRAAPSKSAFMKWGWIDLLASIPVFELGRWGRFVSVLRIIRLFRGVRSIQRLSEMLFENKSRSGVAAVILLTFLLVTSASVSILIFERSPNSNIHTAEDAVWWSVTTITTVGYGDKFPVTTEGRLIAMVLMFSGVGIFGTLGGIVASLVLGNVKAGEDEILFEIRALWAEVAVLRSAATPASGP